VRNNGERSEVKGIVLSELARPLDILIKRLSEVINVLTECKNEREIQNVISWKLNCSPRQYISSEKYPSLEIDTLCKDFTIEVKFDRDFYEGLGQVLAQKFLYGIDNAFLLHIRHHVDEKYIRALKDISRRLSITTILVRLDTKEILVMK